MTKKFIVDTDAAPRAIGPYSQAVGYDGLLFISGQIPMDPKSGELVPGGVEAQTRRVMENLQAVLMAAGLDFSHVLKTTVYLRNMNDFTLMNDVYSLYFDYSPPARATVEVSRLPKDVLVEIDMIAAAPADYEAVRGEAEEKRAEAEATDEREEEHGEEEIDEEETEHAEEAEQAEQTDEEVGETEENEKNRIE